MSEVIDCYDYIRANHIEDCYHDEDLEEEYIEWLKDTTGDDSFCVGEEENLNLASKTIRILAAIRNKN